MANRLSGIYMKNVQHYNRSTNRWQSKELKKDDEYISLENQYVVLYHNMIPTTFPEKIDCYLDLGDVYLRHEGQPPMEGYTMIHSRGIPESEISPLIRYNLVIEIYDGTSYTLKENPDYNYMMPRSGMSNHAFIGNESSGNITTPTAAISAKFNFPAILGSISGGDDPLSFLKSLLTQSDRWRIIVTSPIGRDQQYTPERIGIGNPTTTGSLEYGMAMLPVSLSFIGNFSRSGEYTLKVYFKSNSLMQEKQINGTLVLTVNLLVEIGTTQPMIVSFDSTVAMNIEITQPAE